MDVRELRKQSASSLAKMLKEAQDRLQELRFELSANQLKDVREVREVRAGVAQMKTILREKAESEVQGSETSAA